MVKTKRTVNAAAVARHTFKEIVYGFIELKFGKLHFALFDAVHIYGTDVGDTHVRAHVLDALRDSAVLLSVDYGFSDFGVMRFFDIHPDSFEDPFYDLNETNRLFAGVSHNLRAGLEARLTRHFSARAGLSFLRRSERCWTNSQGNMVYADQFINDFYDYYENHLVELVSRSNVNSDTFSYSFGLGYSSDRSFFADFAVRFTNYPDSWFSPYYDYDNFDAAGNTVNAASPVLTNYRKAVNMALTLGWRF